MKTIAATAVLVAMLVPARAQQQSNPKYHVTAINIPGAQPYAPGAQPYAFAINNRGQVVGTYLNGNKLVSFVYWNGQLRILGQIDSRAINDHGQVVGQSDLYPYPAVLWSGGNVINLGNFTDARATAINDSGVIVGNTFSYTGITKAFIYQGTIEAALAEIPIGSYAAGINNRGQVVGTLLTVIVDNGDEYAVDPGKAFLWQNGQTTFISDMPNSEAAAINQCGHVVGAFSLEKGFVFENENAFLYANGQITNIGSFYPTALNDLDQVVGSSYQPVASNSQRQTAVLWSNGTLIDLNTLIDSNSGWELEFPLGINNSGQIVGQGTYDGVPMAFLLTPYFSTIP